MITWLLPQVPAPIILGKCQLERYTMGMKTVPEAPNLRSLILQNLEQAIVTKDPLETTGLMNFVIIGGGPTGVELAGALAELLSVLFLRRSTMT